LTANIPSSLYHYTTEEGRFGIIESGVLRPSLVQADGQDAKYGSGQYFTNIAPQRIAAKSLSDMTDEQKKAGQISLRQLLRLIMAGSLAEEKLAFFIQFDVSNLIIESTEDPCIYIHRSETNLDIRELIIRSGRTLK
jgi:HYD1 signature containing ADP-ribosyltransferase